MEPIEDNLACDALSSQRLALVVWLILYALKYTFHLAGVHFTPGILSLGNL